MTVIFLGHFQGFRTYCTSGLESMLNQILRPLQGTLMLFSLDLTAQGICLLVYHCILINRNLWNIKGITLLKSVPYNFPSHLSLTFKMPLEVDFLYILCSHPSILSFTIGVTLALFSRHFKGRAFISFGWVHLSIHWANTYWMPPICQALS